MSNVYPYDVESMRGPIVVLLHGDSASGKTTCLVEWANRLRSHGRKVAFSSYVLPLGLLKGVMPFSSTYPTWSEADVIFVEYGSHYHINKLVRTMGSGDRALFVSDLGFNSMEKQLADYVFTIRDYKLHIEKSKRLIEETRNKESDNHEGMIYNQYNDKWSFL